MYISEQPRFIFIHNPKSGGTSMEQVLRRTAQLKFYLHSHAYASDGLEHMGRESWRQYYSFGFVRNPWARLVSWYSMIQERPRRLNHLFGDYIRENAPRFEDLFTQCTDTIAITTKSGFVCQRNLFKNQIEFFTDNSGEVAVSFIGRFERLQADFQHVQTALGLPTIPLPKANATQPKDYRSYYNDYTHQCVAERFKRDIDYFGYAFDDGQIH